jgi:hypothetical protein
VDIENATDADKAVAAQTMRGGSRRSMQELGAGATYATWYFSSVADPFGTGANRASIAQKSASKQAVTRARTQARNADVDRLGHKKLAR